MMMLRLRTALASVVALTALVVGTPPAQGAMMTHHDLASLVDASQVVVLAERTGGTDDLGEYRVTRVLAGSGLVAGATVRVAHQCYELRGAPHMGVPMPALDPTAVLFLARDPGDAAALRLVPSGLRIFAAGRAYRFEQWNNPGCYVPVPQGRDPEDLLGASPPAAALDRGGLEAAIARAVARVARVRAALASNDVAARRTALLALWPAPRELLPEARVGAGFFEDGLAHRVFEELLRRGDVPTALEVLARMRGLRPWLAGDVEDERLLAEARAPDAPAHRRAAAIELIRLPSAEVMAGLVELARADAAPEIRAAALQRLAGLAGTSSDEDWARRKRRLRGTLSRLLRAQLATETAPLVRIAMFGAAEQWNLALPARGTAGVALLARREGDHVRWWSAVAGPVRTTEPPRLERAGAPCPSETVRSWSTGQRVMGGELLVRCGPGPVDLVLPTARGVVTQGL